MKEFLISLWNNKKVIGFIAALVSALGAYLEGKHEMAYGIVAGYIFPSFWPTAPKNAIGKVEK